jgi:hypothetical protein
MQANLRHISCDAITHTQSGLSAKPKPPFLSRGMNDDDKWQQRTNAAHARAGVQPVCELTLVLLGVLR